MMDLDEVYNSTIKKRHSLYWKVKELRFHYEK